MQSSGRAATDDPPVIDSQPPRLNDRPGLVSPFTQHALPPVVDPAFVAVDPTTSVDVSVLPAAPTNHLDQPALQSSAGSQSSAAVRDSQAGRPLWQKLVWNWPTGLLSAIYNVVSLTVLLAVVSAIPLVQLVSLGYILRAAANLSSGQPWRTALPGIGLAGRVATFAFLAALMWLPVWLVTDLSYSVQLLRPGTAQATAWRVAAFLVAFTWVAWIAWAAMRGGRWWHLLWPRPIRFMTRIWRPSTWAKAADDLWALFERTRCLELWWLGLRAAVGALVWLAIPVSLMIIGLRAEQIKAAPLLGLIGALTLTWVMLYLPFQQILLAERNRLREIFNIREIRKRFRHAPLAMGLSLVLLFALAIPLYLLRIEATPQELTWLPSLFCVALMFPSKLALGAAMGYGARRPRPRHAFLRWTTRMLCVLASLAYVGTLYIAQFVAWQGIYVMYFQHAVLVPVAN